MIKNIIPRSQTHTGLKPTPTGRRPYKPFVPEPGSYAAIMAKNEPDSRRMPPRGWSNPIREGDKFVIDILSGSEYFIIRRDFGRAVGILNYSYADRELLNSPLFMQFGNNKRPYDSDDIFVRDVIKVTSYTQIGSISRNPGPQRFTPREFEDPLSQPAEWLLPDGNILPSALAIKFEKTKAGSNVHVNEIARLTNVTTKNPRNPAEHPRWVIEFVSPGFIQSTEIKNHQISGDEERGFPEVPWVNSPQAIHYYEVVANQTWLLGPERLVIPAFYQKCRKVELAKKTHNRPMLLERLPKSTYDVMLKNKGIGYREHSAQSYNAEWPIIWQSKLATAAAERYKLSFFLKYAKLEGVVTGFGPDHMINFRADDDQEFSDNQIQAITSYFSTFSEAFLSHWEDGKWVRFLDVNIMVVHHHNGKPSEVILRRIIRRFANRKSKDGGDGDDDMPPFDKLAIGDEPESPTFSEEEMDIEIPESSTAGDDIDRQIDDALNIVMANPGKSTMSLLSKVVGADLRKTPLHKIGSASASTSKEKPPAKPMKQSSTIIHKKDEFDMPDAPEEDYWKAKKLPMTNLRLEVDSNRTGLENRIDLFKKIPWTPLQDEPTTMREELRSSLAGLLSIQRHPSYNNAPRYLIDAVPRFHTQTTFDFGDAFITRDWTDVMDNPTPRRTESPRPMTVEDWDKRMKIFTPDANLPMEYDVRGLGEFFYEISNSAMLNEEQILGVAAVVGLNHPIIFLRAPAGTGKTTAASHVVANLRKHRAMLTILAMANNNIAAENLAMDIIQAKRDINVYTDDKRPDMLYIQANIVQVKDAVKPRPAMEPLKPYGLEAHAKLVLEAHKNGTQSKDFTLTESQLKKIECFLEDRKKYPGCYTVEDDVLEYVILASPYIKILVGTTGKIMQSKSLLDLAEIILIAECGQFRHIDVEALVGKAQHVQQVFITGDDEQLPPWMHPDWQKLDKILQLQVNSIAEHMMEFLPRKIIELTKTYRFHRDMVPFLSRALYNNRIVFDGNPANRVGVANHNIPVCSQKTPITLVHSNSPAMVTQGKTLCNPEQEEYAIAIVKMLKKRHPTASIAVICYYAGSAKNITENLPEAQEDDGHCSVHTVHAYVGNEADYVIVVTSRTKIGIPTDRVFGMPRESKLDDKDEGSLTDFVHEPKTTTVALTRGKEALWVIGYMDYLAQFEANDKYLSKMANFTRDVMTVSPPLDGLKYKKYLEEMTNSNQNEFRAEYSSGILTESQESFVGETKISIKLGWMPGAVTRYQK